MTSYGTQEQFSFITQDHHDHDDDDDDNDRSSGMAPSQVLSGRRPPSVFQGQAATIHASAVHGRGMWQNFLRSFADPLYALLDLFDNAVDATWNIPKQHNNLLEEPSPPKIKVDVDTNGQGGIYIRNASSDPIPSMSQILEVFRSAKEHHKSAIGENGVGIKHACANLSDLSLVLTKTTDAYSLGVLMKDLQQDVPHFPQLTIAKSASIYGKIKEVCEGNRHTWGKAVEAYGDGDMYQGIDRICIHFEEMRTGSDWKDASDVFTIIISKLRQSGHSEKNNNHNNNGDEDEDDLDLNDVDEGDERSYELLGQFAKKLPQLYIHLNQNIQVQVCGKVIDMAYWETRLASLTCFEVAIPQEPEKDPSLKLTHAEKPYAHPTVRFWLGFNVYRPSASAHIYYYSRQSGRLIKDLADCRSMLKLLVGSTDFKQGLTIILDDHNSTLPLNPTKQDLSFAFQEFGDTHKTNLNFWLSGVTQFFWTYHFEGTAKKSKRLLTTAVTRAANLFDNAMASKSVHPLSEMDPIRFENLLWSQRTVKFEDEEGRVTSYTKLFVASSGRQAAQQLVGRDTLVQLSDVDLRGGGEKRKRRTSKRESSPTKKKRARMEDETNDSSEDSDEETRDAKPRKKSTARKSLKKSVPVVDLQELAMQKEMLKAKEAEIKALQTEKDKEMKILQREKEKEMKLLRKEKEKEIKELLKEKANAKKEVLEVLRKEKEEEIKELLEEKKNAEKEVLELREALEAAKRSKTTNPDGDYSFNVRFVNEHKDRRVDIRVPAEANRSVKDMLRHDKIKEQKMLSFDNETLGKLNRKEALLKVGVWDPSRAKGDYSYIYDLSEMKNETTLQLFNFLKRDGMAIFLQKYDPVHLCLFAQDKPTLNEDEGEFVI